MHKYIFIITWYHFSWHILTDAIYFHFPFLRAGLETKTVMEKTLIHFPFCWFWHFPPHSYLISVIVRVVLLLPGNCGLTAQFIPSAWIHTHDYTTTHTVCTQHLWRLCVGIWGGIKGWEFKLILHQRIASNLVLSSSSLFLVQDKFAKCSGVTWSVF